MKKSYPILIAIMLLCSIKSTAQTTFAPVGAEWWYHSNSKSYDYWSDMKLYLDRLQSVKDTVVDDTPCRKLLATRYVRLSTDTATLAVVKTDSFFIYNNEDTVFVYDRSMPGFTPLYIFNVNEGDTICTRIPHSNLPANYHANYTFCYVIDSIRVETYDDTPLKSYYTHSLDGNPDQEFIAFNWGMRVNGNHPLIVGRYTEQIGGNWPVYGGLFPNLSTNNPDYPSGGSFPSGTFRCYKDNNTDIKMEPVACDYVLVSAVGISGPSALPPTIRLYPNPAKGNIVLDSKVPFAKNTKVTIRDMAGKLVHSMEATGTRLSVDVQGLQPGSYILQLQSRDGNYYQKVVIAR